MPAVNLHLEAGDKILRLTIETDPRVVLRLDAQGVDLLVSQLGRARERMQPAHPEAYPSKEPGRAVADPQHVVDVDLRTENPLLHVRDPKFGWLHYMLTRAKCRRLAEELRQVAESKPLPRM